MLVTQRCCAHDSKTAEDVRGVQNATFAPSQEAYVPPPATVWYRRRKDCKALLNKPIPR